jgi:transposase
VIRFNEQGPDGLINIPSPGVPPKLNARHKAFLARIVEEGPIPAIHGVVRWRACDLIMRLYEEFGLARESGAPRPAGGRVALHALAGELERIPLMLKRSLHGGKS